MNAPFQTSPVFQAKSKNHSFQLGDVLHIKEINHAWQIVEATPAPSKLKKEEYLYICVYQQTTHIGEFACQQQDLAHLLQNGIMPIYELPNPTSTILARMNTLRPKSTT